MLQENECVPLKNDLILVGKDKWLGGELGPDKSTMYCVPGSSSRILRICSKTDNMAYVGPSLIGPETTCSLQRNAFKWLRGICVGNAIYCIPANAEKVLKITHADKEADVQVELLGGPYKGIWKWHGGAVSLYDNNIYCIPCNATQVLKIDTTTDECSLIGDPTLLQGTQKWYGGLLGNDGCVYGIPNSASSVLKINPVSQQIELLGPVPNGNFKWHGGAVSNDKDNAIYGFPSHANQVIKIVPRTGEVSLMNVFEDSIHGCMPKVRINEGKYKFGGGVLDPNTRNVYCFPSDACQVLKIDTTNQVCSLIGPRFENEGYNKWQNGYYQNGYIYAIPCNATKVLRIHPETDQVDLVGEGWDGNEKWEGGIEANGSLYCVPQQETWVLKITPPTL